MRARCRSGPILESEVNGVLTALVWVPGVERVENKLEVHSERDYPALQGGRERPGDQGARPQKVLLLLARVVC
jgi:hypothetical protein